MLAAPPQPVVLATSADSYLVAPAAGRRITAWLEFPAARAVTPDAAVRRRANRLVVADRAGRRSHVVYDGGCSATQPCDTVTAPLGGDDTVLYAVAESRHTDLAASTLQIRPARLVAQFRASRVLPPYALAGPEAVWYAAGLVRARPPDIRAPARTLAATPAGGVVRAVVRREPVTAWLARDAAGRDGVYEQVDGGHPATLYRETRPGVHLTSLAILDGGRVAVVALRSSKTSRSASVLLVTPRQPEPQLLATSAPSPLALAYDPVVTAFGQRVAFRRRAGSARGLTDQIVVLDVLRGTTRVVTSARLRSARLSDPSLGFGRVVWSAAVVSGARLVRSRVLATPA